MFLDDIKQQVQEWDDDYCGKHSDFENRGINVLLGKKKEKIRPARNYYHVYNDQGDLIFRDMVMNWPRYLAANQKRSAMLPIQGAENLHAG